MNQSNQSILPYLRTLLILGIKRIANLTNLRPLDGLLHELIVDLGVHKCAAARATALTLKIRVTVA